MPPTAQRLREPAAFVLLAFGAISTFFFTISFLFGPGDSGASTFSSRAPGALSALVDPVVAAALVGAVYLAHQGTHMKAAKPISLVALISIGVAALFGVVALFSTFGVDGYSGWDKTVSFFVGVAKLGIDGVAGMLILGYFQQHAPARPAAPPAPAFAPQGQWQQPQQQWQPQAPQGQPVPQQQWGTPAPQQQPPVPPQQQWGTPAPQPQQAPQQPQGGYQGGGTDSMMTQAIPTMGQSLPQNNPPQPPAENGGPFQVGNWTSE